MEVGHVVYGIFILILVFLVLNNYKAANGLIQSSAGAADTYTRSLQGR